MVVLRHALRKIPQVPIDGRFKGELLECGQIVVPSDGSRYQPKRAAFPDDVQTGILALARLLQQFGPQLGCSTQSCAADEVRCC